MNGIHSTKHTICFVESIFWLGIVAETARLFALCSVDSEQGSREEGGLFTVLHRKVPKLGKLDTVSLTSSQ